MPSKSTKTKDTKENIKNDTVDENRKQVDKEMREEIREERKVTEKTVSVIRSSNVLSPYIDTSLVCPVMLYPNQLDNKKYLHIKTNLSDKLVGKCYKNYGYISKIYKIDETSDGIIEAEDPTCSAKFVVKFSCRLCFPIKDREIIFKIDRMNKALIGGINGPLRAIITPDKINKEKFYPDNNRNIRIKGTSNIILPEMYIKVLVLSSSFSDSDANILVIGNLQDIATPEEVQLYKEQNNEH